MELKKGRANLSPRDKREVGKLVSEAASIETRHEDIEKKLSLIQKGTKTRFAIFSKLHNDLRMKYRWYYNWHLFFIEK